MRIRKVNISNIFLFMLVLMPIYQDSPFSSLLGAAGYYLLMPLSLGCYVLHVLIKGKIPRNEFLKNLTKLGIWMSAISFIAIFVWIILDNPIYVVGEFLPYKAVKVLLQYFSYPAYIALLLINVRKNGIETLQRYLFLTLVILTIICLIEQKQSPYAFQSLHFAAQFPYRRIRLLTMESSATAMLIFVYTGISLYYSIISKRKVVTVISLICAVVLFSSTGSKALMSSIAIFVIVYVVFSFRKLNTCTMIGLVFASIVMLIFIQTILPLLSSGFTQDIRSYTSVATRIYTSIIGLLIGCIFPIGVGGAVYLGIYQNALLKHMASFKNIFPLLNTSEIMGLATKNTDVALTVKSGILHFNMYWGILGTIFLFSNFKNLSKQLIAANIKNNEILLSLLWTAIILMIVALNFTFEFWLLYSFLMCMIEEASK